MVSGVEVEGVRRLGLPALDDRIAGVDRLVGPDQARDAGVGGADALDHVAERIDDLGDLLAGLDLLADPDPEPQQPAAMQLRYFQTLTSITGDRSSTVVFPLPIELMGALEGTRGGTKLPG